MNETTWKTRVGGMGYSIKMYRMECCELDSSGWELGQLACCYEHDSKRYDSM